MPIDDGDRHKESANTGNGNADERYYQCRNSWPSRIALKIAEKFHAYLEKGKSADYRKECRERLTILGSFLTALFTFITAIIFYCQLGEMRKVYGPVKDSADAATNAVQATRDQLTLAHPPQLKVSHFHIWEKGHGKAFALTNVPPPFIHGTIISGALLGVNNGSEDAVVDSGGCLAHWQKEPWLPMNSPLRRDNPDIKPLKYMDLTDIYKFGDTIGPGDKVPPGRFFGCEFENSVQDGKNLYVLGYIHFRDRLKTLRTRYFARKYDPAKGRFSAVENEPDYEGED
ncbi:hypothetical protein MPC4_70101 [Methylocella tundrae]|uniref:Uncharacterized protein n=1 Tax=Methylocella tundrae TaxID=227605 RepID=A0A8B6MB37_METTU|nr:hypothetical protein [Methylocella tundrae]VTZ26407.1 hypothetical protein MPC1_3070003 [Methylocella tundrae]VTZ52213.1 hypothetical protein MPC4_70101 [Methylocella tundrae]